MLLGLMKQGDHMHIGQTVEEGDYRCDICAWLMEHG